MRIAFLGLGRMGLPMVRHLLELGHTVAVFDRTPEKAHTLIAQGAVACGTVAEAVTDAEVAITMLPDDAAVTQVVQGPAGMLQNLPAKAIHLCMSTISVEASAMLASQHAQAKQGYVAAPVFGQTDTVESRHIWFVAGGPEPQVNRCRPIFDALGRGYTRVGSHAPLAHAVKLGGDMLTMAMELAVSELLIFAKKAGLPPADYLRFLNTVVFRAHMVEGYGGGPTRPSFDPEDQSQDLAASELVLQQARDMGAEIPVADLLQARLQAARARGWGEQDLDELSEACRLETGVEAKDVAGSKTPTPPSILRKGLNPAPVEKVPDPPATFPAPPLTHPRPLIPPVIQEPHPQPALARLTSPGSVAAPAQIKAGNPAPPLIETEDSKAAKSHAHGNPAYLVPVLEGDRTLTLDLAEISHFELIQGQVWAWSDGNRYRTPWSTFGEVEQRFNHVLFLLIQRRLLLQPDAVLDLRPKFGGGAKARVSGGIELDVSRAAAPRLKMLLGI